MLIRPDALMAIFVQLSPAARAEALEAFRVAVRTFGSRSASHYLAADGPPLIEIVAATAPQLGWGLWTVDVAADAIRVTVANSPFAMGIAESDAPVCAPIVGMLSAVGSMMAGHEVSACEIACAANGHDSCLFKVGV